MESQIKIGMIIKTPLIFVKMETPLYLSMNAHTKKRFLQRRYRYGKEQPYRPHGALIKNLCEKHRIDPTDCVEKLKQERKYLQKLAGIIQ